MTMLAAVSFRTPELVSPLIPAIDRRKWPRQAGIGLAIAFSPNYACGKSRKTARTWEEQ
jgi:hypothetical protein